MFTDREIFLQVGDFSLRWYGVLWVLSFWLIWYLVPKLQKYRELSLSKEVWTQIIAWGSVGAFIGGRIGYVVLYEPQYFLHNPSEIFALWQGGMASHGGFIGAALAVYIVLRRLRVDILAVADVVTVPIAIGLTLGRLGNWINQELFIGNFALVAAAKDILVAILCYVLLRSQRIKQSGMITAAFLILYSILRFLVEFLRDDPWSEVAGLTRGQLYTLPLFILGVWLGVWLRKRPLPLKRPTDG